MLPSDNNCNNDLVSYTDQSIFHKPFFNETNIINSKEDDDPPLSFFHFPPPSFIHYHEIQLEDHNFFLKQIYYDGLSQPVTLDDITVHEIGVDMVDSNNISVENNNDGLAAKEFSDSVICNNQKPVSKRYSSSKDRHSKINTAKGLRDRRMRLSLEVARKFFDLQDMLGYDKGSKTVEWLLIQANPEIMKLQRCFPEVNYWGSVDAKSTFEGEVEAVVLDKAAVKGKLSGKKKEIKHSRKTIRPHAKDLREKARARARERTASKKMMSKRFDYESKLLADEVKNKGLGTQTQNKNHSLEVLAEVDQEPISSNDQPLNLGNQEEEIVNDALVIMEKWIPISNCYLSNEISQEHYFSEFQCFGKP